MGELLSTLIAVGKETEKFGEIILDIQSLKAIIDCGSEKDLAEAGKKVGEIQPKSYLALMNKPCSYESCFNLFTELLREHNNWYSFDFKELPEITIFTFVDKNKLGKKWLIFVEEYTAAMVKTLLNVKVKITLEADRVSLEIYRNKQPPE